MSLPLVEILMSTYNGERYLREQIDSVLAQQGVRVRLTVRDDGSSDDTLRVLQSYRDDGRVVVRSGENLGLPQAFFRLIQDSGDDADFWALADQDDVWLPHKLCRAVLEFRGREGPVLYCARVMVANEALHPLYPHALPKRGPSFANALVQNIATGCTIVFNRAAREMLRDRWPTNAAMHDAWIYLVISGTGDVVYDPEIVVHYRQHDGNVIGMGRGRISRTWGRARRQLTPGEAGAHGRQDAELLHTHADHLPTRTREQLETALAAWSGGPLRRLRYALAGAAHRQTAGSNLVLRFMMLFHRV